LQHTIAPPSATLFPYTTLFRSQRPKLGHAESEDTREHDGVEKTDCNHAPHCEVTTGKHGKCDEHRRTKRAHGKEASRLKPLQNTDRKSTRLNSSHVAISYAVFC